MVKRIGWMALAAAISCVMQTQQASATNYYWDTDGSGTAGAGSGTGTWTDGNNWNTDSTGGAGGTTGTAPGSGDNAYFAAGATTGVYTVSLGGASVAVNGIVYNTANNATIGSAVGDGTITVGIGGINTSLNTNYQVFTIKSNLALNGNQTWTNSLKNSGTSMLISGAVSGTGNLTLSANSSRQFSLTGSINHTGSISVNGGYAGTINISGNIGSNVTNLSLSSLPILYLSGTNSYSGATTISAVNSGTTTLHVGSNGALSSTTVVTIDASQKSSVGYLDLGSGTNSYSPTVAGILANATAGSGRQGMSFITNSDTTAAFAHTGTLTVNPTSPDTYAGRIIDGNSSRVGLAVGGSSTLTLASNNTYTGGTAVNSGTLAVNSGAGLTTNVTVNATGNPQTATVTSTSGMAIGQVISASNFPVGTTIMGINGTTLYLSNTATATGTNSTTFSAWQSLGSGAVTASGTGTLDLGGSTTTSVGTVTVSGGTIQNGTLTGSSYATSSGTVSAILAGTGGLTQSGVGTTTLSGVNTYTGATSITGGTLAITGTGSINSTSGITINGGTLQYSSSVGLTQPVSFSGTGGKLLLDGSSSYAGAMTITNGNTLGGHGTYSNTVTINSGATLSPGNSPGQITVGMLVLDSGSTSHMEIAGTTLGTQYDNVTITNNNGLTYGGLLEVVSYGGYDLTQVGSYNLFTLNSGTPSGDFSNVTVGGTSLSNSGGVWTGSSAGSTYQFTEASGILTVTIPEPATASLMLGVISLGMMARRRRAQ